MSIKEELAKMCNRGLELEHAARIQYLAHAEEIRGLTAEPIANRLIEIAGDEEKHEKMFRNLIANFLGGECSMGLAETHKAKGDKPILEVNLKGEKDAIDFYKQIYAKATDNKKDLQYEYETIEHEIRHIIIDEQEHVVELSILLGLI